MFDINSTSSSKICFWVWPKWSNRWYGRLHLAHQLIEIWKKKYCFFKTKIMSHEISDSFIASLSVEWAHVHIWLIGLWSSRQICFPIQHFNPYIWTMTTWLCMKQLIRRDWMEKTIMRDKKVHWRYRWFRSHVIKNQRSLFWFDFREW